ncbi:MAG TPA: kelch repeat-containing protein [Pyrinomonadaceae bacterium]|nr:kelch repeat-containing protein [Pyrinomonadaceae bacterium]
MLSLARLCRGASATLLLTFTLCDPLATFGQLKNKPARATQASIPVASAAATPARKWSIIPSMPHARYGLGAVALNNKLYAIDGYGQLGNGQQGNTNFVEIYDPATNSWSAGVPTNLARYSLAAVALGGKIYAIGGQAFDSNFNVVGLNVVEVFDPATNQWGTAHPLNTGRYQHAAAVLDGKIYAIGGFIGSGVTNSVEVFDPLTNQWSAVAPLNTARRYHAAAVAGGKLYAIGGTDVNLVNLKTVEVYDPVANAWTFAPPMSTARVILAAATLDNKIYAMSGFDRTDVQSPGTYYDTVEVFDPATNQWSSAPSLSAARVEMAAAALGNNLYALGGRGADSMTSNRVEQLAPLVNAGDVIISEFRAQGTNGTADEFVEFYNNTDSDISVGATDNTAGWALVSSDAPTTAKFVITNGTRIPARGHYLATGSAFSLGSYPAGSTSVGAGDLPYAADLPLNSGIALFGGASSGSFTLANRLDAVGPNTLAADSLFKEGNGHPPLSANPVNYTLFRNLSSGRPQDTGDNYAFASDFEDQLPRSDFVYADADGLGNGMGRRLGFPGPESTRSPVEHNAAVKAMLIDPSQASSAPPNRVRSGQVQANAAFGTLSIQRRFKNATTATIKRLRFRIIGITTYPSQPNVADLRVLSSTGNVTNSQGQTAVIVTGLTLESSALQTNGGGFNSTLTVALPGGSLAPGATIDVQFLLGVQQQGAFRFIVNVEALTEPASDVASDATRSNLKTGTTKTTGSKQK